MFRYIKNFFSFSGTNSTIESSSKIINSLDTRGLNNNIDGLLMNNFHISYAVMYIAKDKINKSDIIKMHKYIQSLDMNKNDYLNLSLTFKAKNNCNVSPDKFDINLYKQNDVIKFLQSLKYKEEDTKENDHSASGNSTKNKSTSEGSTNNSSTSESLTKNN